MTAVLFLMRAVILILLWGFVIAAIVAVRHDIFGTRNSSAAPAPAAPPPPRPAPKPQRSKPAPAPAPAPSSTASKLVIVDGTRAGHTVPLSGSAVTIGRAPDSTVVLSDDYVSNNHARLVPRGDGWLVEDLGSTNGTYVGRQRVSGPTAVKPGVQIRVGRTVMELRP